MSPNQTGQWTLIANLLEEIQLHLTTAVKTTHATDERIVRVPGGLAQIGMRKQLADTSSLLTHYSKRLGREAERIRKSLHQGDGKPSALS